MTTYESVLLGSIIKIVRNQPTQQFSPLYCGLLYQLFPPYLEDSINVYRTNLGKINCGALDASVAQCQSDGDEYEASQLSNVPNFALHPKSFPPSRSYIS